MKSNSTYLLILFVVALTSFSCKEKKVSDASTIFSADTIAVKTIPVHELNTNTSITSTGLLTTVNEAKYAFKTGGVIESITVHEGQFFKKGQLLATLKLTEIDAQLAQAKLAYEKAQRDYVRASNLYKDSVYTLEQLQNSKTGLDVAQKAIDAIDFNKKYAFIYADANGFVTKKLANEGEIISGGMPVLAINEISDKSGWILQCGVTDKQWAGIKIGDKASLQLDAFPNKNIDAKVFRKSQAADETNGSFQVEIKLDTENIQPAIGMFGKATIYSDTENSLPTIPYDALVEADGNNAFVFVPFENNKVKKVPVVIESFNNKDVVIKSGIENIADIIVSNSAFLNENSVIKIIK